MQASRKPLRPTHEVTKKPSFFEEKEARRLLTVEDARGDDRYRRRLRTKVFCFFFSKKKSFLPVTRACPA
jgi:hypothetical protein